MLDELEQEVDQLKRHMTVLNVVINQQPIGIDRISNETGYAWHKIRYSLRLLEEEDIITPTDEGALTTEKTPEFLNHVSSTIDHVIDRLRAIDVDESKKE